MKILSAVLLSAIILPAHAGIVIYGTRVIYPAEKKEVVVQLVNQGEQASLVQSWIDDGNTSLPPEKIQVPFMLTPPVASVAAESGQQIKIKKMPNSLPDNKESLFYLNVLDIPPNSQENAGKNVLKFAMQNRIKLIWRPSRIAAVTKDSFQGIGLFRSNKTVIMKNDTVNWITVTDVKAGNTKINDQTIMLPPLSTQNINMKYASTSQYEVTIIDDNGNYISSKINVK
ncbi:fimbria/pilus periplasmic chaperone [Salmonella enterica]|nr:fimbria/pilus periplasmic chaperone [Salmonella enterica]EGM1204686.1 fimbria/pilus periplasmic chaperone [Salmonella enterica]EHY3912801.1 fimbria/pilus periplasmic chaperone [Salmonella enterica]EIQ1699936.1 fimbria/pilus periplasmic chaperone [Salmonella enterica]